MAARAGVDSPPISWIPRLVSAASAATTARPSSVTPFTSPRSTFHASSASRPVVAASPFMTQAPANTSAVLASTYVPVTVAGLAASVASVRLESATDSRIFFIVNLRLPDLKVRPTALLQAAAVASVAAAVRTNGLPVGAQAGLRQHAPPRGLFVLIVERRLRRVHHSVEVHAFRAELQAVHPDSNFRRGQRVHCG